MDVANPDGPVTGEGLYEPPNMLMLGSVAELTLGQGVKYFPLGSGYGGGSGLYASSVTT